MNKPRSLFLAFASFCCIVAIGQKSIVGRECWFDGKVDARQPLSASVDLSPLASGLHSLTVRVKDSEGLWSSTITKYFVFPPNTAEATSIAAREYWIDGKVQSRSVLADAVAEIDVSGLSAGLHNLTVRAMDDRGVWSSTMTKYFVVAGNSVEATSVAVRKYWIDGKEQNRKALTDAVAEVDLSGLNPGLHNITVRVMDDRGIWSSTITKYFVFPPNTAEATSIAVREYWIDGKVQSRSALADAVAEIDVSGLSAGLHNLTVRAMDDRGVWSSTMTKYFVVAGNSAEATSVAVREYWIDGRTDTRIPLDESVAEIDLSALRSGLHSITVHVQDDQGIWSAPVTQYFVIASDEDAVIPTLTHYVYWFDDDNASAQSGKLEDESGIIDVSIKRLPEGEHTINWAVGNSRGHWSAIRTENFTVSHLPLTEAMISIADNTFEYAAEAIEPTVIVTDDGETLVAGEDYNLDFSNNINAGTATVSVSGTGFYKETVDVNFTITKALLTVTADDQSREAGEENPELTLSYSGWKGGDDVSVLTAVPTASTDADADSPVGEYEITVGGGEAQNYDFSYICGTLSVVVPVGIRQVTADEQDDTEWYSTSGQRLHKRPKSPGVYIHKGRKVLIK